MIIISVHNLLETAICFISQDSIMNKSSKEQRLFEIESFVTL